MFGLPGTIYVYLIYGRYWCLNIATAQEGVGEAVLIRALEPVSGIEYMCQQRGGHVTDRDLCRGPGRLTQALAIDRSLNGMSITTGVLVCATSEKNDAEAIVATTRIGIKHLEASQAKLRFYLKDSKYISSL